jgi:hypothetical protein
MSHQPFETWLLDQQTLAPDDQRALQAHLDECPQGCHLQRQWQMVYQELLQPQVISPAPGFTQRWQEGLAIRKAHEQRKQAWKVFGLLVAIAMSVLLVLSIYTLATTSPTDWLVALAGAIFSTTSFIHLGIHFINNWLSSTPLVLNLILWIYLALCICLLIFAWVVVLWRTNHGGVFNNR